MNALQRVAGGAAPYIAEIIKNPPDCAGSVVAHAVVNATLAVVQEITPVPVPQVLPLETWWG